MTTASSASPDEHRLSLPALIAFALPGLPTGALAVALTVYLPRYYAGHFGLGLAIVGGAFGTVRIIDMLFDPFIGVVMDRTRTAFGRYRLWLVIGAPILMAAVFMLFVPPFKVSYGYLIFWLFIYYIATSIIGLSHSAWASVIASKYHERSRVFGVLQVVAILGATAVLIVPSLMKQHDGGSEVQAMGWFIIAVAPIGVLLAIARTPERIIADQHGEKFGLRDYWDMISRPEMARIIVADFCLALGPGWMSAMYLFYFHDSRGFSSDASRILLAIYIVAGVIGAACISWLATRLGKHRTLQVASTCYSLGLIVLQFTPKGLFGPAAAIMFLLGFMASGFPLLDRAMVADVGDAVRLEQGKHRVGLLYAMITSTQKIAGSLSIALSFTVLGWIGYDPKEGAVNTAAGIHGMELVYLIAPVVFVMLGGACYIGYRLDSKRHAEIRAALEARDAVAVPPVLESLSGSESVHDLAEEAT
ncbi:MAG TPA: MFS transporter [Caulobacteraceae bacterium]|nr:MFS transporter [Caulobacteraceae bacterium]